jgi:hypothetical protein
MANVMLSDDDAVMLELLSCTITGMKVRFWMRRLIRDRRYLWFNAQAFAQPIISLAMIIIVSMSWMKKNNIQACRQSNGTTRHIRRSKYSTYIQVITVRKREFSNSEQSFNAHRGVYVGIVFTVKQTTNCTECTAPFQASDRTLLMTAGNVTTIVENT